VIPTKGAIVPAAVGVDLGRGMMAVRTSIRAEHLPDSLAEIRSAIEKAVPHGRTTVGKHYDPSKDRGLWFNTPEINQIRFKELEGGLKAILEKQNNKLLNRAAGGAEKQLGTLGTGNHFIEVCLGGCPRISTGGSLNPDLSCRWRAHMGRCLGYQLASTTPWGLLRDDALRRAIACPSMGLHTA
jgi:hypothetical protein